VEVQVQDEEDEEVVNYQGMVTFLFDTNQVSGGHLPTIEFLFAALVGLAACLV
jgi:hypothetical protein